MHNGGVRRGRALLVAVMGVGLAASGCADDGPDPQRAEPPPPETTVPATTSTSSTTTEATTTTVDPDAPVFEPLLIDPALDPEAQVEAAYLHHWEILMDAVVLGRSDQLAHTYVDAALDMRTAEIESLIADGLRFGGHVEHNYAITLHDADRATVMDGYWNHLYRVDAASGEQLNGPTGEQELHEFQMTRREDRWLVSYVVVHTFS